MATGTKPYYNSEVGLGPVNLLSFDVRFVPQLGHSTESSGGPLSPEAVVNAMRSE